MAKGSNLTGLLGIINSWRRLKNNLAPKIAETGVVAECRPNYEAKLSTFCINHQQLLQQRDTYTLALYTVRH